MRSLFLFVLSVSLLGCVSEQVRKRPDLASKGGPGPVEEAEREVRRHISDLPSLSGQQLLARLQEIIAYKELALKPVIEALPEADPRTQGNLLYILGYVGGTEAQQAILPYLASKGLALRFEAAAALLQMGNYAGVPALMEFMGSTDRRLRFKAFEALSLGVGKDFGYRFNAPLPERLEALKRVRAWWEKMRSAMLYGEVSKKSREPAKGNLP